MTGPDVTDEYEFAAEAAANYEKMIGIDRPLEERRKDFERVEAAAPAIRRSQVRSPDLSQYRVVVPDWALDANGPAHDVIALEHLPLGWDTPPYCLIYATTLPWNLSSIMRAIGDHDAECTVEADPARITP